MNTNEILHKLPYFLKVTMTLSTTTRSLLLAACVAIVSSAISSPTFAGEDDAAKFAEGLKTWETLKEKCGGNYSYTVRWSSAFGFGHSTEVVVRDNKVVARNYEELAAPRPIAPGEKPPAPKGWKEEGDSLGSHKNGAPAKTLDELYAEAKVVAAKELPSHLRRYIRLDKQGLPTSCFTVDTRIADDAPTKGLNVSSIKLETP